MVDPPEDLLHSQADEFRPSPELEYWVTHTFIQPDGELYNPRYADDHNLHQANITYLWTNVECVKKGKHIAGRCSIGTPTGGDAWSVGKKRQQIRDWFGLVPDFIITLDASYVARKNRPTVLALIEHELHHCGQKRDKYGMPSFNKKTGRPKFTVLPHDVEEFVGVVDRYGADATGTKGMVEAANTAPTIGKADINRACGTCLKRAA